MTDPCWLPSAIMQTTAAILGLYVVVYVLSIERTVAPANMDESFYKVFEDLDKGFIIVLSLSIFTIFLNAFWLDSISAKVYNWVFSGIEELAIMFFCFTLLAIFTYTLNMVMIMKKVRRGKNPIPEVKIED